MRARRIVDARRADGARGDVDAAAAARSARAPRAVVGARAVGARRRDVAECRV